MRLEFDIENVAFIEFGVGRDDNQSQAFVLVPVDVGVQKALHEMVRTTWDTMQKASGEDGIANKYEPSEKHGNLEYCYLPLNDDMSASMGELHKANNLELDSGVLKNSADVFCYFARLTDGQQRRLTAVRRAAQFKGILKSKNRLVRIYDDSLQIIEDDIFKLDSDFDLLIDGSNIHILRPSGFEFVGKLQQAILNAVPKNITALEKSLPFVEFDSIREYATKHPRAARYLASIRGQVSNIDKAALKNLCKNTGVEVMVSKGKIVVSEGHEMGFLEVLDRRRYEVELVKGQPERFKAGSRKKLNN